MSLAPEASALPRLSRARHAPGPPPPFRLLQFGGGNFLRAFLDAELDGGAEGCGVVVVRSTPQQPGAPRLADQDGLFTSLIRGIDADGRPVDDARLVTTVLGEIAASEGWQNLLKLAADPGLRFVVSNTTEAGIVFDPAARPEDAPPASFPAKLVRLLLARYEGLGPGASGLEIYPFELIDENGRTLAEIVARHAADWGLPVDFRAWLTSANVFYDTLVDQIVPGFPTEDADALAERLGYEDDHIVVAEPFRLLVVERRLKQPAPTLPLIVSGNTSVVAPSILPFKERKVAILNGGHTALCPIALLCGHQTVAETMRDPRFRSFLDTFYRNEVLPSLSLSTAETAPFVEAVLARFANPFIRHRWSDISLNGIAKFRVRNLPRLKACLAAGGTAPLTCLSLGAWAAFYLRTDASSGTPVPRDSNEVVARFDALRERQAEDGPRATIEAFLAEAAFWGEDLRALALAGPVTQAFCFMTSRADEFHTVVEGDVGDAAAISPPVLAVLPEIGA